MAHVMPIVVAIVGGLMLVASAVWVVLCRPTLSDQGSIASILGLFLAVGGFLLTAIGIRETVRRIQRTLAILASRLILGDVVRAVVLARDFRKLCRSEDWRGASDHADELENVLSTLAHSSSIEAADRTLMRDSSLDISLVSKRLRANLKGKTSGLDDVTFARLDRINRELAELEGRLKDIRKEATYA